MYEHVSVLLKGLKSEIYCFYRKINKIKEPSENSNVSFEGKNYLMYELLTRTPIYLFKKLFTGRSLKQQ